MTTPAQVKQALELALELAADMGEVTPEELKQLTSITANIQSWLKPAIGEEPTPTPAMTLKESKHPVDVLLKKGKATLSDGRYKQLVQIYDALQIMGVKFLSGKQNQHVTWFPLSLNNDKSAALFLGAGGEWVIEPLAIKANGELTGEWEGFDLNTYMEDTDFDQDEY